MTREVVVRRVAKAELRKATAWYRNISRELGRDFVREIDETIHRAAHRPWRS
jgi:hypothetical protein